MASRLDTVVTLARLGYIARGVVYLVVGWFAVKAALGSSKTTDTKGALQEMLQGPFGVALLSVVALGLVGYSIWRLVQALLDVDDHGTDAKGLAIRGGLLVSAVTHIALAIFAITLIAGTAGGGGSDGAEDWTKWLLEKPFGRFMVGAVGLAIIGAAAAHAVKAYRAGFLKRMRPDPEVRRLLLHAGRIGLAARGVVFAVIGLFFLSAAWFSDASRSGGLGEALSTLQEQTYGPWLLGVVAVGLLAFAVYSILEGLYRQIDSPNVVARLKAAT